MPPMKMNDSDRMLQLARGQSMGGPSPPLPSSVPCRRLSLAPSSNETLRGCEGLPGDRSAATYLRSQWSLGSRSAGSRH